MVDGDNVTVNKVNQLSDIGSERGDFEYSVDGRRGPVFNVRERLQREIFEEFLGGFRSCIQMLARRTSPNRGSSPWTSKAVSATSDSPSVSWYVATGYIH